ncbi:uncharacterized protein LOC126748739 isoform X2 [Anthonomus grandis grandis]|nr:uncharacterized protein LOC126748739 isoform X2 [Anthonomus grandis grandis]XP_050314114.1 uncharacterized protein LOC126748739 isoform X2 [Anthonomus grandis grandis]
MHRPQDSSKLQTSKEPVLAVTPVLQLKGTDGNSLKKSIIKKTDCFKVKEENSSKRRVTFSETPSDKTFSKDRSKEQLSQRKEGKECSFQKFTDSPFTPVTGTTTEQFYSAKSEIDQFHSAKTNQENLPDNLKSDKAQLEGYTPVHPSNNIKINPKIYIYNNLETMTSLENKTNEGLKKETQPQDTDSYNEISMELTPAKPSRMENVSDIIPSKKSEWDDSPDLLSNNHICTPEEEAIKKSYPKTPFKTPLGKCDYSHVNLYKKFKFKDGIPTQNDIANDTNCLTPTSHDEKANEDPKTVNKTDDSKLNALISIANPSCCNEECVSQNTSHSTEKLVIDESPPVLNNNHIVTPAIPGKLNRKGDLYKTTEETSESNNDSSSVPIGPQEVKPPQVETNKPELTPTDTTNPGCNTLWLSAHNLDSFEEEHDENKDPNKSEASVKEMNSPEPAPKVGSSESPEPTGRRVSIVMPTPILKRTNVQMKFQIPGHFSSTPIMSNGVLKMKQTKIVEEISTRVFNAKTPYKTPEGKCSYSHTNTCRRFDLEAGSSNTYSDEEASKIIGESSEPYQEIVPLEQPSSVSVSSMTESTLWSSMTRIMKSVLGGFSSISNDSNISTTSSTSFKRQLSDSEDVVEYSDAPRLKRFKFTDIKCRRPIRDLQSIGAPPMGQMERYNRHERNGVATLEIVKSVSTLYGGPRLRVQCDKATQTDDYLMIGWVPRS